MLNLTANLFENAIFIPRGLISEHDVVYDQHGALIMDSCVRRGIDKQNNFSRAPEQLPEKLIPKTTLSTQALFLGAYDMHHYGHWLTEGVARLWFLNERESQNRMILTGTTRPHSMTRKIYDALRRQTAPWVKGLTALKVDGKRFRFIREPTRVSSIQIPSCSIYLDHGIHPAHLEVTKAMGKRLHGGVIQSRSTTPVYLSRVKLNNGISSYKGEEIIEKFCRAKGFRILSPETMTLQDQITAFNEHDTFIGFFGSAFHTLLLRWANRPATNIYLGPTTPYPTFFYIDQLMGNKSHHIKCCTVLQARRIYECDPETAISGIEEALDIS